LENNKADPEINSGVNKVEKEAVKEVKSPKVKKEAKK
jgi:hypothetical protein